MRSCRGDTRRISAGIVGALLLVGLVAAVKLAVMLAVLALPLACFYWFVKGALRRPSATPGPDGPAQRHAERMAAIDARHRAQFGRTFNQASVSDRR